MRGRLGELRRLHVELVHDALEAVVRLHERVRVERARLDHVGARVEVRGVDSVNHLGLGEHEEIVVALEIARMIREARAAVIGLRRAVALHHRPHRAVEHDDAVFGERLETLKRAARFLFFLLARVSDDDAEVRRATLVTNRFAVRDLEAGAREVASQRGG